VSHASGGGVGRHIEELAHAIRVDAEVLLLSPAYGGHIVLSWLAAGEALSLTLRADDGEAELAALLRALAVSRVHVHHVHGLPRWILALPDALGCAVDVTLHDYFPACPAYHLTGGDGRFCGGEPDCMRCLERGPAQWDLSIEAWRSTFGDLMRRAERVIAPSEESAARIRRFFPAVTPLVWPHPEARNAPPSSPARVLVPGAISPAKGIDLLEACVRDAARRALPLHFVVVGYVSRAIPQWPELPLTIGGEYPEGRLPELLALARGDAVFFPAQCPESFSYTLSAALGTGLAIVATDLGALPERLAGHANARIVRWDAPASEINDVLVTMAAAPRAAHGASPRATFEAYRDRYVQPLAAIRPPAAGAMPPVPGRWWQPAPQKPDEWTLAALFEDAVRCGRWSSREHLARRVPVADAHLAEHKDLVREKDAEIYALRAQVAQIAALREESERIAERVLAAESRVRLLERSRSWRLTAPLRAVIRWLGR